jgi:hypothetical protein
VRRQLRLRPAFACAERDDFDGLVRLLSDTDVFGPFLRPPGDTSPPELGEDGVELPYEGHLGDPAGPERVVCLNARESAIKEMSFLHLAAYHGNLRVCKLFLSFPEVDVEPRDWHGMTPLLLAANKNNLPVAQELLRHGADPELTDKFGRSMLLFSKWHTVNVLLVESRRDHLEDILNGVAWSRRALGQLSAARDALWEQREMWGMAHAEAEKRGTLSAQKCASIKARLMGLVHQREEANHAVEDARKVLMDEIAQRDKAARKAKAMAETCRQAIARYHVSKSRMVRAKKRHANLVRKRAEVRALSASKIGIVDAMARLAPLSVDAQAFCALALRVVTRDNPVESAKVVVRGGVDALLSAMRRFPTSIVVQQEGCGALANLVQLNAFAREEVSAQGGIQVVFRAMGFLKDSKETQISGMRLLCGLTGALEESGAVRAALEAHMEKSKHVQPGSIEWDELQRAKELLVGSGTSAEQDRTAAIRVAAFAEPLITSALRTFGYDKHGTPRKDMSIRAIRMAAQALYGLSVHGLHAVLHGCIVPLCDCLAPCIQNVREAARRRKEKERKKRRRRKAEEPRLRSRGSTRNGQSKRGAPSRGLLKRPGTSSSAVSSVSFSEDGVGVFDEAGVLGGGSAEGDGAGAPIPVVAWNAPAERGRSARDRLRVGDVEAGDRSSGEHAASESDGRSSGSSGKDSDSGSDSDDTSEESDDDDDDDWISRAGLGEVFTPEACGSGEHLDFLRFAIGALRNIAKSSPQMVDGVLISKAAATPIRVAHAIRACTLWTVEVRARWDMMKRDPLAFVKGGRREGEEPAHKLQLRLQQLQLNCCLLMSVLTTASDAAVRKAMVREGGFEGALFVLQSVTVAEDSEPLGVDNTPERVLTDLKAGAARACYLLLLGVRDPFSSLPYIADARDVVPLVEALLEFPRAKKILEWASRCFATLGIIRKNKLLLIEHGAVEALMFALQLQQHDSEVVLWSLRGLYALLGVVEGCDRAASKGGMKTLMEIVKMSAPRQGAGAVAGRRGQMGHHGEIKNLGVESLKLVQQFSFHGMEGRADALGSTMGKLEADLEAFMRELEPTASRK